MDWLTYAWSLRLPALFIHSYSSSPNYGLNPKMGHWQLWVKKYYRWWLFDFWLPQEVHRREQEIVEKNQELVEMKRKNQMVIYCFVLLFCWIEIMRILEQGGIKLQQIQYCPSYQVQDTVLNQIKGLQMKLDELKTEHKCNETSSENVISSLTDKLAEVLSYFLNLVAKNEQ